MEASKKFFNTLPPWAKGVVAIVAVGGVAFIGYNAYKSLRRRKDEKDASKAATAAVGELSKLVSQGMRPSFADSQFDVYANTLVQAMDSCGTDEQKVYNVFNALKNQADVLKLIIAFGVKYYSPCAVTSPFSWTRSMFDSKAYGGDLATWLNYDMTAGEVKKVNSILQSKGINYAF